MQVHVFLGFVWIGDVLTALPPLWWRRSRTLQWFLPSIRECFFPSAFSKITPPTPPLPGWPGSKRSRTGFQAVAFPLSLPPAVLKGTRCEGWTFSFTVLSSPFSSLLIVLSPTPGPVYRFFFFVSIFSARLTGDSSTPLRLRGPCFFPPFGKPFPYLTDFPPVTVVA